MLVRQFDPNLGLSHDWRGSGGIGYVANYVWDTVSLTWVPTTSGAGGVATNVNVNNWPSGLATEATLAKIPGLSIPVHDYISLSQGSTTDTWTFKSGGVSGTTVATLTITYTSSSKLTISNIAKT